jgi:hypothetical protein
LPATLTIEHSVNNLQNFLADISSGSNAYYYWVGRTLPWPNDAQPPAANQSYQEMVSVYHDMVYGKQLRSTDNIYALASVSPWANGTVYAQYNTTDQNFFNEDFCIYTVTGTQWNIYKCIDNAGGIPSTSPPSLKPLVGCFTASDGYTWKYMYTTSAGAFQQDNFAAITPNTAIEAAAIPGTIDVLRLNVQGVDYQGFNEGIIRSVVSPNQIQLANTAIPIDNFYVGSQLYLKSGLGAGQLSNVVAYVGASQIATVNPSFASYVDMQLTNTHGTIQQGMVVSQQTESVSYINGNGYFNVGDTVIQSDTGYGGQVLGSNSTGMTLTSPNSPNTVTVGANGYPIYDTNSITTLTGVVSITAASNVITSNSANVSFANLMTLSVGQYVRVGNVASAFGNNFSNVRRVTSITNANTANVDIAFANTLVGNTLYGIPNAVEPVSSSYLVANASVIETNLTALTLQYGNTTPNNSSFILGELIKEYSNTGSDLAANGLVSFVNSSTMILSGVQGSFSVGNEVVAYGTSSNTTAIISNISNYPNITLGNLLGGNFQSGVPINFYALGANVASGNAVPVSYILIPSDNVQYILGPTVTISGDGTNATAYAVVNTAPGSIFEVTKLVPINVGEGYTYANVAITAPHAYGNGAMATAVVAPITGHGGDPYTELGARNVGIAFDFGSASEEIYKFPNYGSYRRAGILKNPEFAELFVNISPTIRNNLTLQSISAPAFTNNEIAIQPSTNAAFRVLFQANTTLIQIDNINGLIASNAVASNTFIRGLTSNVTAYVAGLNTLNFADNGNQLIHDKNSNATGTLIDVSNSSQIVLANVGGKFGGIGDVIYDPTVNSYANVTSVYTANGTVNISSIFGLRFNQTTRITLSSNTTAFQVGERIFQNVQDANALVIDTTHEIDLGYTLNTGTLSAGVVLSDTTSGANAVISFVNSSYIRLTGVQGKFSNNDTITTLTGSANVTAVYPVLVASDVLSNFVNNNDTIQGLSSGALGVSNLPGTIVNPDLTKNTGEVLYINDFAPFTQNLSSQQIFVTIFGF